MAECQKMSKTASRLLCATPNKNLKNELLTYIIEHDLVLESRALDAKNVWIFGKVTDCLWNRRRNVEDKNVTIWCSKL